MTISKTIRVQSDTYRRLIQFADARDISIQDAADYLLENTLSPEQSARLEAMDEFCSSLGGHLEMDSDEVEAQLRNGILLEQILKYKKSHYDMGYLDVILACKRCGHPMPVDVTSDWMIALQALVLDADWHHEDCPQS